MAAARPRAQTTSQTLRMMGIYEGARPPLAAACRAPLRGLGPPFASGAGPARRCCVQDCRVTGPRSADSPLRCRPLTTACAQPRYPTEDGFLMARMGAQLPPGPAPGAFLPDARGAWRGSGSGGPQAGGRPSGGARLEATAT
jgi:hypothetical protein